MTHSCSLPPPLSAHLLVFQILDLGSVVAVSLAVAENFEPRHADGVDHRAPVWKKLHISHLEEDLDLVCLYLTSYSRIRCDTDTHTHLQHTAVVGKAFEIVGYAHSELLGAGFHGASDHEAVTRLEHVQWTGNGGEGHGAHEDRHFLVQAARSK